MTCTGGRLAAFFAMVSSLSAPVMSDVRCEDAYTRNVMNISDPYYQEGVIYFGASKFLVLAAIAADECSDTGHSLKAHSAQIMAAVSAEAFIDEFAFSLAGLERSHKAPALSRIGSILQQLEVSRVQITEKLQIASQLLPGVPLDAGTEPFQSFSQLIKLRNFLAHPKVSAKPPSWFSYFVSNRLLVQSPDEEIMVPDWMAQLQSKTSAVWACRTTANIIMHFIDLVREPCAEHDVPGIHQTLVSTWEWTQADTRF